MATVEKMLQRQQELGPWAAGIQKPTRASEVRHLNRPEYRVYETSGKNFR